LEAQDYIYNLEDANQQAIFQYLYDILINYPTIETKIRFKVPFFFSKSWICYINPLKDKGVELAFTRANEFSHTLPWLDFKDRKQVAGMTYHSLSDINEETLHQVLEEALMIDDLIPYASKRKKNQ